MLVELDLEAGAAVAAALREDVDAGRVALGRARERVDVEAPRGRVGLVARREAADDGAEPGVVVEVAERHDWRFEYLAFSLFTKQAVVRIG